MKLLFSFAIAAVFLSSCGSIKPAAPDLPQSPISSTPLPYSNIDIPLTIDMATLSNSFNTAIPAQLTGEGTMGPAQYRWDMQRQPFSFSLSADSLKLADIAHFNAGGYLKNPLNGKWTKIISCDADAAIGISSAFAFSNNYSLRANATLTQFDLSTCNLKVGGLNITPLIKEGATQTLNHALAVLNQQLKDYNFRSKLQPGWAALYQPIKIADIGYITINPSAVRLSHPTVNNNLLSLSAGITAKPVFSLTNPGKIEAAPLPDLSDSNGNGFNLAMDVHVDYTPLNQLFKKTVENQKLETSSTGYLIIKNAIIYGSGNNHLLIKVSFTGKQGIIPYHGLLYFTCLPQYDISTGNFYINDIDFDTNTINKLKEGPAVWILSSAVKKYLNSQVHFNIAGQINTIKDKLNQSINRPVNPHVTLSGSVDSLNLQGILPTKDYLLIRVSATGNMAVKVN